MSAHRRLVSMLDRWAAVLPDRIAEEDLGGFIEQLNRTPPGQFRPCWVVAQAVLFTGCNALRELPFLIDKKTLRRFGMWIAALNIVFAFFFSREPIEYLTTRSPQGELYAQCLAGAILSVLWVSSGVALWRRWPLQYPVAVGTAAATILHTVWLSNILGIFGLVVHTVYPLGVLVVFALSSREQQIP